MLKKIFGLGVVTVLFESAFFVFAQDVLVPVEVPPGAEPYVEERKILSKEELDKVFVKERLKTVHGDFKLRGFGDWVVTESGQAPLTWKLSEKGFECAKESSIPCKEWVPNAVRWWILGKGWTEKWSPSMKVGVEYGEKKMISRQTPLEATPDSTPEEDPIEKEIAKFDGKRVAQEVWDWSGDESSARLFLSLRNSWVEKIEHNGQSEFLEWVVPSGKKVPELSRIILERDGRLLSFARKSSAR